MKQKYSVYLDLGEGGYMAHVLGGLLGCNRTARNRERVISKIREEIPIYEQWLKDHKERIKSVHPDQITLVVKEEVYDQDPGIAGGTNALFTPEFQMTAQKEIDKCIQRMSWNREDLLSLVKQLSKSVIKKCPPKEPRSIANTLSHIADAELWYISRLNRHMRKEARLLSNDPFKRLAKAREITCQALLSLTPEERKNVYIPTMWCSSRQKLLKERWTAKKVLRRLLEHERQHTHYIKRLLEENLV
jgi:uncharacterized damage-inducible protein DinB